MGTNCRKCKKTFRETSWTTDRYWRSICPKCIVEMLEAALAKMGVKARQELGR